MWVVLTLLFSKSHAQAITLTVLSDVVTVVDMSDTKFTFQFGQMAVYHLLKVLAFLAIAWSQHLNPVDPYSFKVVFKPTRGFFTAAQQVTLTSPLGAGSTIRFTTANDWTTIQKQVPPSLSVGTVYTGPITITATTLIRAIAYLPSGQKTNITTHSYFFLSDVVKQASMYEPTVNNPRFAGQVLAALKNLPSFHIVTTRPYPTEKDWIDRPTNGTLEWLDPDNPTDNWSSQIIFDMYGGASRYYPKKNLRVKFRDSTGDGELEFPLFDGFDWGVPTSRKFKSFSLRAFSQDGVFGQAWPNPTWMKNIWHDWLMQDAGILAPHSRYVHLYYNLQYQGLHHLRERMGSHFFKDYLGKNQTDYDGINSGRVFDGTLTVWKNFTTSPTWAKAKDWVDWNSWLTYAVTTQYSGNVDLATHNWQVGGPHYPKPWQGSHGGWKIFPSDQDLTFYYCMYWGRRGGRRREQDGGGRGQGE
jgi:hypothetical protein